MITKVPSVGGSNSSSSDYAMTTNTQSVVSGNTNTADSVYGGRPPAPLQPPADQYHHGQYPPPPPHHGGYNGPPYWDRPVWDRHNPLSRGYNPPTPGSYNSPSSGGYDLPPTGTSNPQNIGGYNPPTTESYNPPNPGNPPPAENYNPPTTPSYNPPPADSYNNPPTSESLKSPSAESSKPLVSTTAPTTATTADAPSADAPPADAPPPAPTPSNEQQEGHEGGGKPPEKQSEEPPTKIWRPHSNDQQESTASRPPSTSRPPSNVATSLENQTSESRTSESDQGQSKTVHKSPQGPHGGSHPVSPALSSSSHKTGELASQSAFASPRPTSGGSSSQHPLAGAGSPLQPQTSPAASSQNSLPPPSSPHMTDSRVPLSSPPQPLTSPPRSTAETGTSEGMPSSMQGLMRQASGSRGSSMGYMTSMLNSDPASLPMQDYLEAERMRRTPELHRYMEMNGSRFGMSPMQSTSPYASHAMQQMGQTSAAASMYGNQLPPMPASQPLPASFSSYGVAASPHLRQLLHNRIPGGPGNQMSPHSAYAATQSALGMGLGPASSMYGGYDRQGPYSAPPGYNMQQAAELQYYQQRSQALKQGYYPQVS